MRITSQMLNEAAKQAGLDYTRPTLLDYINDKSGNSLFQALTKSRQASNDNMNKNKYKKLEDEAEKLVDTAKKLLDDGEESIFTEAVKSGDYTEIYTVIETLFESYNKTIDKSRLLTGTLEKFYTSMLKEIPAEDSELLAKFGIMLEKDGKVSLNLEKLKSADKETITEVFGKESEIISKINIVAEKILDNASANIKSLTSGYTATGNEYTGSFGSKYDTKG